MDVGKERYGMNWPGKAECFKTIQMPSLGTLRPCPEESINFDNTENLIIEGDNLEVLKLLQKSYLGKVKMIYIDPPYNTGNDFIGEIKGVRLAIIRFSLSAIRRGVTLAREFAGLPSSQNPLPLKPSFLV